MLSEEDIVKISLQVYKQIQQHVDSDLVETKDNAKNLKKEALKEIAFREYITKFDKLINETENIDTMF